MESKFAIEAQGLSKTYKLFASNTWMGMSILGFDFLIPQSKVKSFQALSDISLDIKHGERIGLIGRNGAGKSTLLRIISGLLSPTTGKVNIHGNVQSLMDTGVGFHPDFTGLDNIKASLNYNGLDENESKAALEDIISFVELGDFLNQPLRTYSLGMKARLGFATATAIKPEILIVDEVLSAGDGYFAAKSAERVKKLTEGGTTLILVSHSTQQIIQFCDRCIWLDQGKVVEEGPTLEVVKSYERYIKELDDKRLKLQNLMPQRPPVNEHTQEGDKPTSERLSRWPGLPGLKIEKVTLKGSEGEERFVYETGEAMHFEVDVKPELDQRMFFKLVIMTYSADGKCLTLHCTDEVASTGEIQKFGLTYDPIMLGGGDYVFSVALYKHLDPNDFSTAEVYDLIDRSYLFKIVAKQKTDPSQFLHPAKWVLPERA